MKRVMEQPPLKLDTSSEVRDHAHRIHQRRRGVGAGGRWRSDLTAFAFLPLKKVDFLGVCGLTTLARRDHLLANKRRKRRRMMRERSLSPPPAHGKRGTPSPPRPPAPLTTPYTAEQMDGGPEAQQKKDFLLHFHLSHVSPQQRRGDAGQHSNPRRGLFTL